jgi:hypothetical protein
MLSVMHGHVLCRTTAPTPRRQMPRRSILLMAIWHHACVRGQLVGDCMHCNLQGPAWWK